jgi:hypothetical protein
MRTASAGAITSSVRSRVVYRSQRRSAGSPADTTAANDPWEGFASFMEGTCELLAGDRGYADVNRSRIPGTPVTDAARKRTWALKAAKLRDATP